MFNTLIHIITFNCHLHSSGSQTLIQPTDDILVLEPNWFLQALKGWTPNLEEFLCRILVALLIIFIGMRLSRLILKGLNKTFVQMKLDSHVCRFLLIITQSLMYILVFFIAADNLGIPSTSIIALLGSAGLAVGLSLKESLANVAGGILILLTRPFIENDYIICNDVQGTVHNIGLVYTTLDTVDNQKVIIPNGTIANAILINTTAENKRQLDLEIQIDYDSDLRKAKEILQVILISHPQVMKDEKTMVFVKNLGENAVVIGMRGWIKTEDYWNTRWDIIESVKLRFDEEGIKIPIKQLEIRMNADHRKNGKNIK